MTLRPMYKFIFIISHLPDIQLVLQKPMYIQPHPDNKLQSYINNAELSAVKKQPITNLAVTGAVSAEANAEVSAETNAAIPMAQVDEMINCECGKLIRKKSLWRHCKSKKHVAGVKNVSVKK